MSETVTPAKPNLFILGAPRSGTTALRTYLNKHPEIAFSAVREPNFFNTDLSSDLRKFTSTDTYLQECFGHIDSSQTYIGEKTVWYLYSKQAVKNIYQFNPEAKCIVMVRNPITLVQSLYRKLFEIQQETAKTLEEAWYLQDERQKGSRVPESCPDPRLLLYQAVGRLGHQIKRLQQTVPDNQYKLILLDDFREDTQAVYDDVLSWLSVSQQQLSDTAPINTQRSVRSSGLQYLLRQASQSLYQPVSGISEMLKDVLGIKRWNLMYGLSQLNTRPAEKRVVADDIHAELIDAFREDIAVIENIVDRNLGHWLEQ